MKSTQCLPAQRIRGMGWRPFKDELSPRFTNNLFLNRRRYCNFSGGVADWGRTIATVPKWAEQG